MLRPAASIPADLYDDAKAQLARPGEEDPAVIVLSSGTTSVPKGVVHSHRGFIENARTNLYLYQGLSWLKDRTLVPLSTAFIGCYNGWFPFLNAGGCTIFMEHFDLGELVKKVTVEQATHVFLTPTLWRRLLNAYQPEADFRSVRLIGFAAEPMDAQTLKRLRERISPSARPPPLSERGRVISGACRARAAGRPQRHTQPFSAKGSASSKRGAVFNNPATPVLVCIRLQGMTLEDPPRTKVLARPPWKLHTF